MAPSVQDSGNPVTAVGAEEADGEAAVQGQRSRCVTASDGRPPYATSAPLTAPHAAPSSTDASSASQRPSPAWYSSPNVTLEEPHHRGH